MTEKQFLTLLEPHGASEARDILEPRRVPKV